MSAPRFTREPGRPCDLCRGKSEHTAGIDYAFEPYWNDSGCTIARHLLLCAPCAERAARVARGHEVAE